MNKRPKSVDGTDMWAEPDQRIEPWGLKSTRGNSSGYLSGTVRCQSLAPVVLGNPGRRDCEICLSDLKITGTSSGSVNLNGVFTRGGHYHFETREQRVRVSSMKRVGASFGLRAAWTLVRCVTVPREAYVLVWHNLDYAKARKPEYHKSEFADTTYSQALSQQFGRNHPSTTYSSLKRWDAQLKHG